MNTETEDVWWVSHFLLSQHRYTVRLQLAALAGCLPTHVEGGIKRLTTATTRLGQLDNSKCVLITILFAISFAVAIVRCTTFSRKRPSLHMPAKPKVPIPFVLVFLKYLTR